MPRTLTPAIRQALMARLRFYRDLGITEFYRRPVEEVPGAAAMLPGLESDPAGPLAILPPEEAISIPSRKTTLRPPPPPPPPPDGAPQKPPPPPPPEGPGADEDAQGLPFVGRAGQLLNNMITAMGLGRGEVYIANVVKCRPPGNRTPEPEEANTCLPFLLRLRECKAVPLRIRCLERLCHRTRQPHR